MDKEPLEHVGEIHQDTKAQEILRTLLVRYIFSGTESISLRAIADGSGCKISEIEEQFGSLAGCYDALYDAAWHEINEALIEYDLYRPFPIFHAEDMLIADMEFLLDTYLADESPTNWALRYIFLTLHNPRVLSDPHYVSETQAVFEDQLFELCQTILTDNSYLLPEDLDAITLGNKVVEIVRNTAATWLTFGPDSMPKEEVLELIRLYLNGEDIE